MAEIHVLSSDTINRIAAGEVVERPVNVVKELAENAIDAGSTAITIEIKNGGIDLIRVTDNGCGIEPSQITKAFRRHATSKINDSEDLSALMTLGFRGEALSSIASVSQVEMITKTRDSLIGIRATNEVLGSGDVASLQTNEVIPLDISEVGAPDGTTVIVRNIFYNVPVRKKFLKAPQTEAGYITDLVEQLALSHPDISFHYRVNNQEKLHTTGNGNEKELIYRIYGREMSNSVIPIDKQDGEYHLKGYLGRPEFSRSSRNFEVFFVNNRILKSNVLSKGLEEGYRTDLMQHRFPFAILHLEVPAEEIDVNVHPTKMEVRFSEAKRIYDFINESVHQTLHKVELIPQANLNTQAEENARIRQEEKDRQQAMKESAHVEAFEGRSGVREASAPYTAQPKEPQRESFRSEAFSFEDKRPAAAPAPGILRENTGAPKASAPDANEILTKGREGTFEQASFVKEAVLPRETKPVLDAEKAAEVFFQDAVPAAQTAPAEGQAAPAADALSASVTAQTSTTFFDESAPTGDVNASKGQNAQGQTGVSTETNGEVGNASGSAGNIASGSTGLAASGSASDAAFASADAAEEPAESFDALTAAAEAGDKAATSGRVETMTGESLEYHILSSENVRQYHIVGQVFDTYWIVEFKDKMLMIDQHAAHEKVNFERLMKRLARSQQGPAASQMLAPPIIVNLTGKEEAAYLQYQESFRRMGYEIEEFGSGSYALRAIPMELYANQPDALIHEVLEEIMQERMSGTPAAILYKIASMSCKAAVKGNMRLSYEEAQALIDELLSLDNPYHCPHGRPTMIVMSKSEMEKKFKRIV